LGLITSAPRYCRVHLSRAAIIVTWQNDDNFSPGDNSASCGNDGRYSTCWRIEKDEKLCCRKYKSGERTRQCFQRAVTCLSMFWRYNLMVWRKKGVAWIKYVCHKACSVVKVLTATSGWAVRGVGLDRLDADTVGSNPALGMDVFSRRIITTCHSIIDAKSVKLLRKRRTASH
jgi:hypothetical protein